MTKSKTQEVWQSQRKTERKTMTGVTILPSLVKAWRKKYPEGNFSMFVEMKLIEELRK